jgi:riboflavin synthase
MFTGLVERTGIILSAQSDARKIWTLVVDPGPDFEREHGASIAVNGVCLTEIGPVTNGPLTFHVSEETLSKTSLAGLGKSDIVNLERAMRPTDRLGGHIVLGHVDGTATVSSVVANDEFHILTIHLPSDLSRYVVMKGSIALDGVSLTINDIRDDVEQSVLSFTLIPLTWSSTRFAKIRVGDRINVEVDIIAKHLERLAKPWTHSASKN